MNSERQQDAPQLSLIVPCYNEAGRLPETLARLREYLEASGHSYEILVVDDGSGDGTAEIARHAAADFAPGRIRVLDYNPNRGKGYAVALGAAAARGEWILFSDADLSTPIEELARFLPCLSGGCDIVIGSRAIAGANLKVHQPWWREQAGRLMNSVIRRFSGLPFADTQCGFKLFTRRAAGTIFPNLTVSRWLFDVEVLVLARKLGYTVREEPVTWINAGESRVKLSHAPNILRELFHIRRHWLRRQPEVRREEPGAQSKTPQLTQ